MTDPTPQPPDRNLALELVRVTEAAALAAAPLVGQGDKEAADQAAVDGMRYMLQSVQMDGVVVIGEGEKDEAPMLYNGEQIGDGSPPQVDIAVDPLEGTTLAAHGMPSALAVIALSSRGTMFDPGPCVYMEKMAGAPEIADLLDLDRPLGETVRLVAERKGCAVGDVMVVVLDRPRHEQGIAAIREAGARVRLIAHGDVSAALLAVTERSPVDLLWGIGGTPEGVISAAAVKCLGGQLSGGCGRATRPSARRRSTPATTSSGCSTATIWSPARTCSSRPPASPTGTCCRACAIRAPAAPRPNRSSRARARARSGASAPRTTARSCGPSAATATDRSAETSSRTSRVADRSGLDTRPPHLGTRPGPAAASERRKRVVTITWIRSDCVAS